MTMKPSFVIPDRVYPVESQNKLPIIELSNDHGQVQICLQGAQVIRYAPRDQQPTIWLSQLSNFNEGKAIRGGIPICWPWFGDHPVTPDLPAHGFARTSLWRVQDSAVKGQTTCIQLVLEDDDATRSLWPHAFRLELLVQLDHRLTLTLSTHNPNDKPMPISEALHSYLAVSDINQASLKGLEGCRYRDKLDTLHIKQQQEGALQIREETDKVYLNTDATVRLDDPAINRRLIISKTNSRSTVIWNPWQEKSRSMSDMTDEGYLQMLCVEAANALDNALEIPAGESHSMTTSIESLPLEERRGE